MPLNDNLPARRADGLIHGLGACDMKGGVAVGLRLAATLTEPNRDITYVFYDCEEIESERNGLFKLTQSNPELLQGVFAVVMEPSNAVVEAGCQGTMRVEVTTRGERAHSARSWMGKNAIHGAGEVLARLAAYEPRRVPIDGLEYREGLNAVAISGGVAGNVVPDLCTVTINYRFAPSRSEAEAEAHVREVFEGYDVAVTDSAPGGLPGARAAGRGRVPAGGRGGAAAEVRLDGCRAVHAARRTGGELRAGRPAARAQAGGVRARGGDRAV